SSSSVRWMFGHCPSSTPLDLFNLVDFGHESTAAAVLDRVETGCQFKAWILSERQVNEDVVIVSGFIEEGHGDAVHVDFLFGVVLGFTVKAIFGKGQHRDFW